MKINDFVDSDLNDVVKNHVINNFVRFLKENNVYDEYMENSDLNTNFIGDFIRYFTVNHPKLYIMNAFGWMGTKQGADFWEKLHSKWLKCDIKIL